MSVDETTAVAPLPKLKVIQENYCSQEMTDNILECLEKEFPEILEKIKQRDFGYPNGVVISAYLGAMVVVRDQISKKLDVPTSDLGYIDLNFELMRRFRTAHGLPVAVVQGKPLAESINGPYPAKLAAKELSPLTIRAGFDQPKVDEMVDQFYQENQQWCYVAGEAFRRNVNATYLFENPLYDYFSKPYALKDKSALGSMQLRNEAGDRIRKTCGII